MKSRVPLLFGLWVLHRMAALVAGGVVWGSLHDAFPSPCPGLAAFGAALLTSFATFGLARHSFPALRPAYPDFVVWVLYEWLLLAVGIVLAGSLWVPVAWGVLGGRLTPGLLGVWLVSAILVFHAVSWWAFGRALLAVEDSLESGKTEGSA